VRAPARLAAALIALGLLAVACTASGTEPVERPTGGPSPTSVPTSPEVVPSPEAGPGSALAALEELCTLPEPGVDEGSDVPAEGRTPPVIAKAMRELEQIRGFGFSRPVVAEPVTQAEIAEGYADYLDEAFPEGFYERRSLAWQTIGVIPDGTNIRDELLGYGSTEVIGYYDTLTGELVFIGTQDPSPLERITLVHELTHAIDDQRFGLETIDRLGAECRDEELEAALALVEGNATFFMLRWAQTFLTLEEQLQVGVDAATQDTSASGDIAPFIEALQLWPYEAGLTFITNLSSRGGVEAIDDAFEDLPTSTEQVIHPERYPNDVPIPVDVPDLAGALGSGWEDLDVQHVGEAWLVLMLRLRLDGSDPSEASAGWDGGLYRAWSDGDDVAVVLATEWDSEGDAQEFADAMGRWIAAGDDLGVVLPVDRTSVRVVFASDAATLASLGAGAA